MQAILRVAARAHPGRKVLQVGGLAFAFTPDGYGPEGSVLHESRMS